VPRPPLTVSAEGLGLIGPVEGFTGLLNFVWLMASLSCYIGGSSDGEGCQPFLAISATYFCESGNP
jgi:hypothetical protein